MQIVECLAVPDAEAVESKTLPKRAERILDLNPTLKRKVDAVGCHPKTIQNALKQALAQTDVDAKPRSVKRQKRVTPNQKGARKSFPGKMKRSLKAKAG
eukprot:jgi/Botrbrau1/11569/Bobra.60_1s0020.1